MGKIPFLYCYGEYTDEKKLDATGVISGFPQKTKRMISFRFIAIASCIYLEKVSIAFRMNVYCKKIEPMSITLVLFLISAFRLSITAELPRHLLFILTLGMGSVNLMNGLWFVLLG